MIEANSRVLDPPGRLQALSAKLYSPGNNKFYSRLHKDVFPVRGSMDVGFWIASHPELVFQTASSCVASVCHVARHRTSLTSRPPQE